MSETGQRPARVGVRELRQNLSVYLDRVKQGEVLEVTEHGHPVAHLTPRPLEPRSVLSRLIAEGHARPATRDLLDIVPVITDAPPGRPLSEILQEMRDEDDR